VPIAPGESGIIEGLGLRAADRTRIRSGMVDARARRPPCILGLATDRERRRELARDGFRTVANLLLMGILLDSVFRCMIVFQSYPGPALVVGPVLITAPYTIARALTNRAIRSRVLT
jgi:hypothetical protein